MTASHFHTAMTRLRAERARGALTWSWLQSHLTWLITIGYAILSLSWKHSFFADTWWLVYVPVWAVALRKNTNSGDRPFGLMMKLSAILLFAWLLCATQSVAHEAIQTWEFGSDSIVLTRLSYLLRVIICSVLGAALLATPLKRIVGSHLVTASLLVGLPSVIPSGHGSLFSIGGWSEHPAWNLLLLVHALMPPLVLAWTCKDQHPLPTLLEAHIRRLAGARRLRRLLGGNVNTAAAFCGIFIPALLLMGLAMYERDRLSARVLTSWVGYALQALLFIIPFSFFAVGTISAWSSLARFKRKNTIAANIAEFGQFLMIITATPLTIYCIFAGLPNTALAIREGMRLVPGRDWRVVVDGNLLRVSGEFTRGIADSVRIAVDQNQGLRVVVLDSPGGNIGEGLQIARVIKDRALSTAVRNRCSSACTFAFVAGQERILLPNTRLGFHACRQMIWYAECNNAEFESFFVKNGIAPEFIKKGMSIPSTGIWYPTVEELIAAHVVTRTTKPTFENTHADLPATVAIANTDSPSQ